MSQDAAAHPDDYYELLEVGRNSDADEIKRAYRRQALKWHPDKQDADNRAYAEERFKLVSEAYQVLSDPQKRAAFDQFGKDAMHHGSTRSTDSHGFDGFGGFSSFGGFGGPGMRVVFTRTGPDGTTFTSAQSGADGAGFGGDGFDHPFFRAHGEGPGLSGFDRGNHSFFHGGRDPFALFRDMFASEDVFGGIPEGFGSQHADEDAELRSALRISRETAAQEEEKRMRELQPDVDDHVALQAALRASRLEQ